MSDVEDELHVHGGLRYAGATAVDDGNQGAVQLVHVALREESTSATGLVLHLRANTSTCVNTRLPRLNPRHKHCFLTMSACVEMRRESELMPLEVRTVR